MTTDAVIVDAVRTPIGRADAQRGMLRGRRGDDLAADCVKALIARTGIAPDEVEDVTLGVAHQIQQQGLNAARLVALLAELPPRCAAATVNRLCGSGMQAVCQAAHAICAGAEQVHLVGGFEHMTSIPVGGAADVNPRALRHSSRAALEMGLTAEHLARMHCISRTEQDQFALLSHQRAAAAQRNGRFDREIIATDALDDAGLPLLARHDQGVRQNATIEALAALPPAFARRGTVTAGNSSPRSDGAAALLLTSAEAAERLGLTSLVRVRSTAVVGVEPASMGTAPVPATRKALKRVGLHLDDVDLIELNEAFAVQAVACLRQWGVEADRVNLLGGAIALGHPLGASGARIVATLTHAMIDRDATIGLATMCIGVGQGIAVVLERVG